MNSRWNSDMTLCNNDTCSKANECWRRQALERLADDQGKDAWVPMHVSVSAFRDYPNCHSFEPDDYEYLKVLK